MKGFLLKRTVIHRNSTCNDNLGGWLNASNQFLPWTGADECWAPKRFSKAVIIIIDGLRYDFASWNKSAEPIPPNYVNKLPVIHETLTRNPNKASLFTFIADPPTTTMQRLKGLVTGSLPTFIDAGANFASNEINEDNWVDQFRSSGKKITFMGDDTWGGLFPKRFHKFYPFPSFNVKDLDTVDKGITEHLVPILKGEDWDIVIAHFLGVDHCGHRYGPSHPEMARKLTEMDYMLRLVMENIKNDTLLMALGDHGMTRSGDHGGDSIDEISSALFLYSPQIVHRSNSHQEKTVRQIDMVPTLCLLMGLPIPFSNLGTIIADVIIDGNHSSSESSTNLNDLLAQCRALLLNVHQVNTYLQAYYLSSNEFSHQKWNLLQSQFQELKHSVESFEAGFLTEVRHLSDLKRVKRQAIQFLQTAQNMCEEVWANFDGLYMVCGLMQIVLSIFMGVWLHFTLSISLKTIISCTALTTAICGFVFAFLFYGEGDSYSSFGIVCLGSLLLCSAGSLIIIMCNTYKKRLFNPTLNQQDIYSTLVVIVYCLSLFSNSYILTEELALSDLAQSVLWSLIFATPFTGQAEKTSSSSSTKKGSKPAKKKENPVNYNQVNLLIGALVFGFILRVALNFRKCPEEQPWCDESHFLTPLSALHGKTTAHKQWRYFLVAACSCLVPFALYRWLSRAGNLNGTSVTTLSTKYCLCFATICMCYYWSLLALPANLLKRLPDWQQVWVPRMVFVSTGVTLASFVLKPLTIYLLPHYENFGPVYGQNAAEVIPQVFNHLKVNWKSHFGADNASKEPPIVYGLGTVYSAGLLIVVTSIVLTLMVLLGDGIAPAVVLLLMTIIVLVTIEALKKTKSAFYLGDVFAISWNSIVTWSLASSFFFFATGHRAAFSAIQWNAAFVGTEGDVTSYFLPAAKVLLNTFASQVVFSVALPLLVIWPLTCKMLFPNLFMFQEKLKQVDRGELVAYNNEDTFFSNLVRCCIDYITCQGLKLLACMCSSGYHRRHLMVWKLFAPRFIFEAVATQFVLFGTIVGFLVVCWIHRRLDSWLIKIEHQKS